MAPSFTFEYITMIFTPIYKLLKHQKNPQNEDVFDLFLDVSEIGRKLSKMDVSEIVYNEDIYIPTSDNEESLTDGYYEMQPVLIQANVPTENAANLQMAIIILIMLIMVMFNIAFKMSLGLQVHTLQILLIMIILNWNSK